MAALAYLAASTYTNGIRIPSDGEELNTAYVIIHERNIKELCDLCILGEVVAILPPTLVLQFRCRSHKFSNHVKLRPMDLRWVVELVISIAIMRSSQIRRVHLTV